MKTFLIIDDDPDDVQIFVEALWEIDKNFHCFSACDGDAGIQLLKKGTKPDFIFLDLNMPRMNGKQCLMKIKNDPEIANIPVIIYTTSKIKGDMEKTMQLGASGFLTKPTKFDELVRAIKNITGEILIEKNLRHRLQRH